jgi:hypothetical protein
MAPSVPLIAFSGVLDGWAATAARVSRALLDEDVVWATNVEAAPEDADSPFPVTTVRKLPPGGAVVWACASSVVDPSFAPRALPLRIGDGTLRTTYENQPSPYVSCIGPIAGVVGTRSIIAYVWFGQSDPTPSALAEADSQLAQLVVTG